MCGTVALAILCILCTIKSSIVMLLVCSKFFFLNLQLFTTSWTLFYVYIYIHSKYNVRNNCIHCITLRNCHSLNTDIIACMGSRCIIIIL